MIRCSKTYISYAWRRDPRVNSDEVRFPHPRQRRCQTLSIIDTDNTNKNKNNCDDDDNHTNNDVYKNRGNSLFYSKIKFMYDILKFTSLAHFGVMTNNEMHTLTNTMVSINAEIFYYF